MGHHKPSMPNSLFAIAFLLTLCLQSANATLEEKIDSIVGDKQMTVGVAAECGGKTFLRNDTVRFPLLSVFKTHVAMAAIARLRMEGATTDSKIHIDKSRLRADTYSPMKQKYPHESIDMSVAELLRYSVAESDNNACDILIDIAGGIDFVDAYIRSLGIGGFSLSETEATMHSDRGLCYNNWSYPSAMLAVLKYIFEAEGNGLEQLRDIMAGTVTGQDKIKAGMPPGVVLAHKTGSSDRVNGIKAADNDAGVVMLPQGRCYIVVFIKDSAEADQTNSATIAAVARELIAAFSADTDTE